MKRTKRDIEAEITAKVIAQLEAGVAPWRKSWASIDGGLALRENGVPYRGFNQFLLSLSGYSKPHWFTYNKAAELSDQRKDEDGKWIRGEGRGVRPDEKGTHVHFFKKINIKDKATGEDKQIPLIKFYCVFNADQIDGLPEKFLPVAEERTALERDQAAEEYIYECKADIKWGGGRACYIPSADQIHLPAIDDFEDYPAYVGTAIHELAHWTGAEHRIDRNLTTSHGTKDYAREELVAEASAALICGHLGIEVEPREDHASYLKSWLEVLKDDKTALRKAFNKAQKVVDFLGDLQPAEQEKAA